MPKVGNGRSSAHDYPINAINALAAIEAVRTGISTTTKATYRHNYPRNPGLRTWTVSSPCG